jgi:hypothetical protein
MVFCSIDGEDEEHHDSVRVEESTMDTNEESFSKWSDASNGLCFNPCNVKGQLFSSSATSSVVR